MRLFICLDVAAHQVFFYPPLAVMLILVAVAARKKKEKKKADAIIDSFRERNDFSDVNELYWYVAREVVGRLGFEDCVIYRVDHVNKICEQVAASGPKAPAGNRILNPIIIHFGKGIVGSVAVAGNTELIANTTKDSRYVADDDVRYSELTVPVLVNGKSVAIIDSESRKVNHFRNSHKVTLEKVAAVFAAKLGRY